MKKGIIIIYFLFIFALIVGILFFLNGYTVRIEPKNNNANEDVQNAIVENKISDKKIITNPEKIESTGGGESYWEEDLLKYKSNNKYGLVDKNGKQVTDAEFDKIEALGYEKGYLKVYKGDKVKVVKITEEGCEDFTDYYDEVGILGADYDIKNDEMDYMGSDSMFVIGVNNGIREKYYEIENREEATISNENNEEKKTAIEELEKTKQTREEPEKVYLERYEVIGQIEIPKTHCKYQILDGTDKRALELAICKVQFGPGLNEVGNTVLFGMNYRNGLFFSDNDKLEEGDLIYITDKYGDVVTYEIYKKYVTEASDAEYFTRDTEGRREISLQTSTDDGMKRIIILAKEKEQ